MEKPGPVRGTDDILPPQMQRFRIVIETARKWAELYGYSEIATPIFEFTETFRRTLGETSDVVRKEMFSFQDRGRREITLRPEHTAGIVRAVISNGLANQFPLKIFAQGPTFRQERPQKGRRRQFHQFDVEVLGVQSPRADVEAIILAHEILVDLGVRRDTTLFINTLGDSVSRADYSAQLKNYFGAHFSELSEDSRARLDRNPLRILDSKDAGDRALIDNDKMPRMQETLNSSSKKFFDEVRTGLREADVGFRWDKHLVRGLDYYTHTAFEFKAVGLGAQGTVLAGGRYDGLVKLMGGPSAPGVGWAAGIERLSELLLRAEHRVPPPPLALIPETEADEAVAKKLAKDLRAKNYMVDLGFSGNRNKRLDRAKKKGAAVAIFVGDHEYGRENAKVWDLENGKVGSYTFDQLARKLSKYKRRRTKKSAP